MGCSQSKPLDDTATHDSRPSTALPTPAPRSKTLKKGERPGATPRTRDRVDSWSIDQEQQQHRATASPSRPTPKQRGPTVELQWSRLWETQSPSIVDPADVHAVLDSLMTTHINRLSPVELLALQRRARAMVKSLAGGKRGIFSSNADVEKAKLVVDRLHLLPESVVGRLVHRSVAVNSFCLGQHLSEWLWDRVAEISAHSAKKAGLEMDVNKQSTLVMPKPSIVPEIEEGPELPPGMSLPALGCLTAMACKGTRAQRLQLLFYLLMDNLEVFLRQHPAGGVPVWLLEVDQATVMSLASLTHYHYYGHAFLPRPVLVEDFCPSKSRQPVSIPSLRLKELLLECLSRPDEAPVRASPQRHNSSAALATAVSMDGSSSLHGKAKRRSSESDIDLMEAALPLTAVMKRLASDDGTIDQIEWTTVRQEIEQTLGEPATLSLETYRAWADQVLDETTLEVVMNRLFGGGVIPRPALERELVQEQWLCWQATSACHEHFQKNAESVEERDGAIEVVTQSIKALLEDANGSMNGDEPKKIAVNAWGGLGGVDGGGGIGNGILYCIDKAWWDSWAAYVGWTWVGEPPSSRMRNMQRPGALSTERLLDRDSDSAVTGGSLGSYELMKPGLKRNVDYVLVPPGVWDVLYELYSGGPPLPRMVKPPRRKFSDRNRTTTSLSDGSNGSPLRSSPIDLDELVDSMDQGELRVLKIPEPLAVCLHPWILHVQLCDPLQPYRRGEAGPLSIRVMATPDEPLWRLLAEIVVRFPLQAFKAFGPDNRGKARLWRKMDRAAGSKDPVPRFGPWNLLCKSRHATIPLLDDGKETADLDGLVANWQEYADNATLEGVGLVDQDQLMFEFATLNKNGELTWPREGAAKAGRVRRLAEEDMSFRRTLQGVDKQGAMLLKPQVLVGMEVDGMDSGGRWYPVTILEADIVDEDTDEEPENEDDNSPPRCQPQVSRKKVRVDFKEYGGHPEWIDVESDRLAVRGRFTSEAEGLDGADPSKTNGSGGSVSSDAKPKVAAPVKKNGVENGAENGKICLWPGLGATGLTNLGNTCYINSAIQCISYFPLLRSYLLSAQYKTSGDLNKENPLGTGGKLLEEFAELLRTLWSARIGEKSPTRFRSQLGKINSQFSGADQQDAQEFLNYILDVLHEDSNKVRKKPYVEALEDDWVKRTALPRVGDEAWRRFLRRNRSVMADVAMGQVLNTVTCPMCNFSSRNFDPFNLLSIPIPTVADVVFKCTVIRRATALNCPWVLNKPRKGEKNSVRFVRRVSSSPSGPPSDSHVAEQYVIALSRLADSGDLRLQIQNACGIPANQLRLCRAEEIVLKEPHEKATVVQRQMKVVPLADKEGPCSQLAKKMPQDSDASVAPVTLIVAFETTLRPRQMPPSDEKDDAEALDDTADEDEEGEADDNQIVPSPQEQEEIKRYLDVYGDAEECRLVDTNPLILAKALSRSLWPRTDKELKLGLRVDARDHRGNWFPGNVVELVDDEVTGSDADTGEQVTIQKKKVRVHFDNFSQKWDELYAIEDFEKGNVRPLYSHASPRAKPTEFVVHNRHTERSTGQTLYFGQSFYVQCQNEWSNARAGAHILAQASRFLKQNSSAWADASMSDFDDPAISDRENKARRLYEKTQSSISDLIDLLVDCDREYIRLALGVSEHNTEKERASAYRNPSFDPTSLSNGLVKKVTALLSRLPFEVRVCTAETPNAEKSGPSEEMPYPFSLIRTIGNYINVRHAIILQWREPPVDKKSGSSKSYLDAPVMYVEPTIEIDKTSSGLLENLATNAEDGKKSRAGSAGIDLGVCLTEFCKVQNLSIADNWRCPHCKRFREGRQSMDLWRLPDILTFHIKRFNMSARWREKISTKVNFPLTGLDMSEWCHKESPMITHESGDSYIYDLIGVVNHYGSMTGGHYVATCRATACGREGKEEVAYNFNGVGASPMEAGDADGPTGWRLGRPKAEVNQNKVTAAMSSRSAMESAEPLWLQFDDELVEPIPPRLVVSEMAYVLFYRRRRMTPSNIAKYSTLE